MHPLRVIAAGILLASSVVGQTAASLFDASSIQDIRLTVAPADWDTLRANYLENTYYPAGFEWAGNAIPKIGIRSRGSGSRSPIKPNLLLSFKRYDSAQRLLGLETVVLKANNQDASLLHELISMQLYQRMGIPAPREAPARLFVNDEYFGAYTLVESVDTEFLQHNFNETKGYLYSWERDDNGYHFEDRGADPAAYSPVMWSPENHDDNPDPAPIVAMVQAINQAPDATWEQTVAPYFDPQRAITYLATESFLTDFDGFLGTVFGMNNMYWYRFAGSTLFELIPWDKDNTFQVTDQDIFMATQDNVFSRRALQSPTLRAAYLESLAKAATLAGGSDGWMLGEIDRLYALIGDLARNDPHKQCPDGAGGMLSCGAAEFEQGVADMRQFAAGRAASVQRQVAAAGGANSNNAPTISDGGIVNAANQAGSLSAGSLISIFGRGLAPETAVGDAAQPPSVLGGTMLLVNGARAPLLYVSPTQINAQIPWATTLGPAAFTVSVNGAESNTAIASVAVSGPGIFSTVRQGDTLMLYGTGFGPVDSSGNRLVSLPDVTFNGVALPLTAAAAPGMAGVFAIAVTLPSGAAGSLTLTTAGGTLSVPIP